MAVGGALYVAEHMRGHAYGRLLLDRAAEDARRAGFGKLYLSTDHAGLYETGASAISDRAITRGMRSPGFTNALYNNILTALV